MNLQDFLIQPSELTLKFAYPDGDRRLAFTYYMGPYQTWKAEYNSEPLVCELAAWAIAQIIAKHSGDSVNAVPTSR